MEHDFKAHSLKEIEDIMLDWCDFECAKTHTKEEHEILREVVRKRLNSLIERLTIRVELNLKMPAELINGHSQ